MYFSCPVEAYPVRSVAAAGVFGMTPPSDFVCASKRRSRLPRRSAMSSRACSRSKGIVVIWLPAPDQVRRNRPRRVGRAVPCDDPAASGVARLDVERLGVADDELLRSSGRIPRRKVGELD